MQDKCTVVVVVVVVVVVCSVFCTNDIGAWGEWREELALSDAVLWEGQGLGGGGVRGGGGVLA